MKKMWMMVMVFGFLTSFTRALWSPIQTTADFVGEKSSDAVYWLNGGV